MLAALAAVAWAADPATDWGLLYDARFVEIADGSPENAVKLYQSLREDRAPADPLFATTTFWLGRAQLEDDQIEAALRSLDAAAADPEYRDAALALEEDARLRLGPVTALPARWTFEDHGFPVVRGWTGVGRGEAGLETVDGRKVFAWATTVRPGEPDRITLRFADDLRPRELSFSARAETADTVLRLVVRDEWGARWVSEGVALGRTWTELRFRMADLVPATLTLGPTQLGRVVDMSLEDITGERSDVRGANTLLLDDVVAL
jgi:hypothetical protein